MLERQTEGGTADRRPRGGRFGSRHVGTAWALVAGWLSVVVFVALYRAPLPSDAFAALAVQMVSAAGAAGAF
jgi:hypothetical protein